jgi:hypothetical protein
MRKFDTERLKLLSTADAELVKDCELVENKYNNTDADGQTPYPQKEN